MSTKHPNPDEDTALDRLANDALPLGIDTNDSVHHYSRIDHAVVVETPSGRIERHVELDDRHLTEWITYTQRERGWATLNYADSFANILADALEEADT